MNKSSNTEGCQDYKDLDGETALIFITQTTSLILNSKAPPALHLEHFLTQHIILHQLKAQIIITVFSSSTEAELIAAIAAAAKTLRIVRSVLIELGFPQNEPTPNSEDNASAIEIVNASKTTDRSRYIHIRFFAIQD